MSSTDTRNVGDLYFETIAGDSRGVILWVDSDIEGVPVVYVVEQFDIAEDGSATSVGCHIADEEDCIIDVIERREGEEWGDALRRMRPAIIKAIAPESDDYWRCEAAMQAGMAFGAQGYNDHMGW